MQRHLLVAIVLTLTLSSANARAAARPAKPAWEWTLAERLSARFAQPSAGGTTRFIDGRTNPELFTPTELFDYLILIRTNGWRALPDDETINAAGYGPAEFRKQVGILVANYIQRASEYNAHMIRGGRDEAKFTRAVCRERIVALQALRKRFRNFDKFLYTVIAPHGGLAHRGFATLLREHETGCPD